MFLHVHQRSHFQTRNRYMDATLSVLSRRKQDNNTVRRKRGKRHANWKVQVKCVASVSLPVCVVIGCSVRFMDWTRDPTSSRSIFLFFPWNKVQRSVDPSTGRRIELLSFPFTLSSASVHFSQTQKYYYRLNWSHCPHQFDLSTVLLLKCKFSSEALWHFGRNVLGRQGVSSNCFQSSTVEHFFISVGFNLILLLPSV